MDSLRSVIAFFQRQFTFRRGATVRYMFPLLLGFAVLLGANTITSTESSYIRLESSKSAVMAGERFALDVMANAHVPVNAVNITLRFNGSDFEVLAVDRGQSVLTIWTEEPIITSNSVTLRGGTFRKGFLGEHRIATIELKARETGQGKFSTSDVLFLAGDGKGTPVSVSETSESKLSLFIYDEDTSPEDIGVDVKVGLVTDLDGDGKVSIKDISAFMGAWASRSSTYDFNGDGRMTFKDFSIILANVFFQ